MGELLTGSPQPVVDVSTAFYGPAAASLESRDQSTGSAEGLFLTVEDGAVVRIERGTVSSGHDLKAEVVAFFHGPASVSPEERNPSTAFFFWGTGPSALDSVQVTLPDGSSVKLSRYTDVFSPQVDWVSEFRFHTSVGGPPQEGVYTFTGLDAAGAAIPDATVALKRGTAPPLAPPANLAAWDTDGGIRVTWDEVPPLAGSFEPDRGVGAYLLMVNRLRAEDGRSDFIYGASGLLEQPYLIPRSKEGFGHNDKGSPIDEWGDGAYRLTVHVHGIDVREANAGSSANQSVDPAEDLVITIRDGVVVSVARAG